MRLSFGFVVITFVLVKCKVSSEYLKLLILHNNDMHSRFEETATNSDTCSDLNKNKSCIGGFARTAHEVRRYKKLAQQGQLDGRSVLFLNAGDTFVGTAWYSVHRWKICAAFLNVLKPDVACLGNHEMDDGLTGLIQFVDTVSFPVIAANVQALNSSALENVKKSVILTVNGIKIGVVGYLTTEVKSVSIYGKLLNMTEEVQAVREESERLEADGIQIIIALGHSGFEIDKRIAREVPLVDVVIGGHTNTFLWNGPNPHEEHPEGPYPYVVEQQSGKKVPVVQAYAYTKYIGHLNVTFNEQGDLIEFGGQPEYMSSDIVQDQDVLDLLEEYRPKVDALYKDVIGQSKVYLDGFYEHCRLQECNFGNLVTDCLVFYVAKKNMANEDSGWTEYPIALYNSGNFRNSINVTDTGGNVTRAELYGALPYHNDLVGVSVTGENLKRILEFSVRNDKSLRSGEFLQMSGVKVVYDMGKPSMSRVVSVKVRCKDCQVPKYEPLDLKRTYSVLTSDYLLGGGDGYSLFPEVALNCTKFDLQIVEIVEWYLQEKSPVYPEIQGRISFVEPSSSSSTSVSIVMIISLVVVSVFF